MLVIHLLAGRVSRRCIPYRPVMTARDDRGRFLGPTVCTTVHWVKIGVENVCRPSDFDFDSSAYTGRGWKITFFTDVTLN